RHSRARLAVRPAGPRRPLQQPGLCRLRRLPLSGRAQGRLVGGDRGGRDRPRGPDHAVRLPSARRDDHPGRREASRGHHRVHQDAGPHRREVHQDQSRRIREGDQAERQDHRGGAPGGHRGAHLEVRVRESLMRGGHSMLLRLFLGALATSLLALPLAAWAGQPTEQLKGAIDRVVKTLANDTFDFTEIARRSRGRHWAGKSDAEHEEFVGLFAALLERSYISKIDTYGGEKITYTSERSEGDISVVGTKIMSKGGTEVPIDYRMLKKGDRWLVYDVSIEGVDLVSE